jgi:hypothetical protein
MEPGVKTLNSSAIVEVSKWDRRCAGDLNVAVNGSGMMLLWCYSAGRSTEASERKCRRIPAIENRLRPAGAYVLGTSTPVEAKWSLRSRALLGGFLALQPARCCTGITHRAHISANRALSTVSSMVEDSLRLASLFSGFVSDSFVYRTAEDVRKRFQIRSLGPNASSYLRSPKYHHSTNI